MEWGLWYESRADFVRTALSIFSTRCAAPMERPGRTSASWFNESRPVDWLTACSTSGYTDDRLAVIQLHRDRDRGIARSSPPIN